MTCHLLHRLVENFERLRDLSSKDTRIFDQFCVLVQRSQKLALHRLLTRKHGSVESRTSALDSAQRSRREVNEGGVETFVLKIRKCAEDRRSLVWDEVLSSQRHVREGAGRAGAAVVLDCSFDGVLFELCKEEWLASFVSCVGRRV